MTRGTRSLPRGLLVAALAAAAVSQLSGQRSEPRRDSADRRVAERIQALRKEADALASRERTLLGDLHRLELDRDLRAAEHDAAVAALAAATTEARAAAERAAALDTEASAQAPDVSQRLVALYKHGRAGTLRLLLGVQDLRSLGRTYRQAASLQAINRQRLVEYERLRADARTAAARADDRRARLATHEQAAQAARDAATQAARALTRRIDDIDARRDLTARYVGELETARAALRAGLEASRSASPLPVAAFRGALDWPTTGRVVTPFGRRRHARFQTALTSNGIVVDARPGAPIGAVHDGTVVFAGPFAGFGHLVVLDHGGQAYSLYGHLREVGVSVGATVAHGARLGAAGALLDGTPALYFELRIDGKPVDPLQWLKQR